MTHVTDEELLLDYYGESAAAEHIRVRTHLASCAECRELDRELRAVLALVDSAPLTEAPEGFEREMWARVQPHVTKEHPQRWSWLAARPWALAGGLAVLVIGAFFVGRVSYTPSLSVPRDQVADVSEQVGPVLSDRPLREQLLRSEVGDHLERSQRVLVELVNADASVLGSISGERERAADLVAYGRLYRRSVEETGDTGLIELLEDLERVLIEVANGPSEATTQSLDLVRARINQQDLVFRVRVVSEEWRERARGTRVIW